MAHELQSIVFKFKDDMVYEHRLDDIPSFALNALSKEYPDKCQGLQIPDESFGTEDIEKLKECVEKCCYILGNEVCTGALFVDPTEKRIDIYGTQLFIGAVTGVSVTLGISFLK